MGAPADVLHLDMDAFFASVEVLADPSLAGKPVVVGGTGGRGVVASASYEARRFGVRSAMPMGEARRLCPHLVAISPRHGRYGEVSGQLMRLLGEYTPLVEPVALDEAYLDVAGAHGRGGSSEEIATRLRRRVGEELGLACAVGIGRTKLVAKLASKAAKPRLGPRGPEPGAGVLVVTAAEEPAFLAAQSLRALPGIGPRTGERLARYGVGSVSELQQLGRERLIRLLGNAHGSLVDDLAHGRDPRPVVPDRPTRSIGHEETFERDERSRESLETRAKSMAVSVAGRCRQAGLVGRTVSVKVRYADFTTVTRAHTLAQPARAAAEIGAVACRLLAELPVERGVRLLGVQLGGLQPAGESSGDQLSLFAPGEVAEEGEGGGAPEPDWARRAEAEAAADEIRARYGADAITLLGATPPPRRERPQR